MLIYKGKVTTTAELQKTSEGNKFYRENRYKQIEERHICPTCHNTFKTILESKLYCSRACRDEMRDARAITNRAVQR